MVTNWTGNSGIFWDQIGNWDNGLPGTVGAEDVVIGGSPVTQLRFLSGTVAINRLNATGRFDLLTGATLLINTAGTLQNFVQSGGTLGGAGTVNILGTTQWNSGLQQGSGVTNFDGLLLFGVGGTSPRANVNGKRILNINAGAVWDSPLAGFLDATDSPVINNNSGSVFDIRNDSGSNGSFSTLSRIGGTGIFNNQAGATFHKSGGTGTFLMTTVFNNDGSTLVDSGTLRLAGGGTHTGTFSGKGSVDFSGGTHRLTDGSSVTTGTVVTRGIFNLDIENGALFNPGNVDITNGVVSVLGAGSQATTKGLTQSNGAIAGEGDFIIDGPFNWLGGSHNGTGSTVVNGLLTLDGSNHFLGQFGSGEARTLELNGGATLISANANIAVSDGSVINNNTGSIFDIQTDNGQLNSGSRIGAGVNTGFFNNQTGATVLKSGGSGALIFGTEFNNLGLVEVQRGRLSFANTVKQTAGEFRLNGGEFAFIGIQKLGLEGGTVTGAGTLAGDVENSGGTLTPGLAVGEIGTLQITENYTETDAARVAIDIGSLGHDVIEIGGQAAFDGTLTVNLVDGFRPILGQAFEVVTYAVGTDIATAAADLTFVGLDIAPGLAFNPVFDGDSLTLLVDEVSALTLAIEPLSIAENGGSATGTVTRFAGTSGDLVVRLVSDDSSKATVPTTVTILDGEASATFGIDGMDDAIADGNNTISIRANATGLDQAIALIEITEDDVPGLIVSIGQDSISEAGGAATGTVTRNTGVVGDLVVTLASDDTTEASVPSTVTIPDGESSVNFTITGVDDELVDSDSSVLITASATGLSPGSDRIEVLNDDVRPNAAPVHLFNEGIPFINQIGEDIDGEAAGDQSGRSVSLSADGKTLAIGAPFNDGNGPDSGHVRIYQNIEGTWQQVGQDIDGELAEDQSGASISLSADGTTVAIIAPLNDSNEDGNGPVRIYRNTDDSWQQVGQSITGENEGDFSGIGFRGNFISLSANGYIVAIGAPSNDGNGVNSGHVRIYQNIDSNWQQIGQDIDGERIGDNSGIVALSADGNTVAIGAEENEGRRGHVRVYQNIDGNWQQIGQDINGERFVDGSGVVALSTDGNTVAIGAIRSGRNTIFSNTGHVRVYQNIDGNWQQIGQDIYGENADDFSGRSVSLSADGKTVAISSRLNDGNGVNSGHVRIYQNIDGNWQQFGPDIDGENRGDESGFSVSLSSDGSTVAIGASLNDGNSSLSGHVRIFSLRPTFTTPEDIPTALSGIQVADIDDNVVSSQLSVENGFLTLDLVGGASISAGSNRSASITIQGTQTEINAALATLIYQGNQDFNGEDTLTLISTDAEGLSDTDAIAITVLPVDDPITLAFDTRSISENGGVAEGTVRLESPKQADTVIALTSGDRDKISLPTTLTIPAGETSVTFKVTGIDNAIASGNQDLSITASSDGFSEDSEVLRLIDDEELSLTITTDSTSISENGGTAIGTVTRNTGTVGTVTVNLTSSDSSEAIVPDTVTIQPGRDSARFVITGIDDAIADGTQTLSITADAPGFRGNKALLDVTDDETPALTLSLDVRGIAENGGIAQGTITRNTGTRGDLTIKLSSSDRTEALVPETVVILDGQDTAIFPVRAVDDAIVDGSQDVTLRAIADGFPEISIPIRITDDDVATLTLSTDVNSISENGGNAIGQVTRNTETSGDLVVTLSSDDPSEATLPATVTILDGQASAEFNITGLDDTIVDGTQTIAITAASDGFSNGRQPLDVIDDDRPTLIVSIDPDSILENGGSAIGTVTRNTETSENLRVMLAIDDPGEAFIPAMVIIPRGQDSVDFIVTGIDDAIADGNQLATITASADQSDNDTTLISFQEGSDTVVVLDDEVPELSLIITPNTISENGGQAQATVARNTGTNGDLEVSLESLDLTEATVPISVTIPNGQTSVTFTITGVDDDLIDDGQQVEIEASTAGFITAIGRLEVTNDDVRPNVAPLHTLDIGSSPLGQIGQDIDGESPGDNSGRSVSISADGNFLAIGAFRNDGNGSDSGHVRVYQNIEGDWQQVGQDIDGENAGDRSGRSVSLSADGNILAIGANLNDGNGSNSGHVRVYQNIEGNWQQLGQDIDGENAGDRAGFSVSLSADGSTLAIGAPENDENGRSSGHVRVYQNIEGSWQQIGDDIDGEALGDDSGSSISLSADGSTLAIGARFNDGNGANSGHVRIYQNTDGNWQQIGQDIDGENPGDQSGFSVSLAADGNTLAVGAWTNDENGFASGHVRVYQNIAGDWQQLGQDIDGETEGDVLGTSISLSADGNILAIGATGNDENGSDSGHVRIYQNVAGLWQQIGPDIDGETAGDRSGDVVSLSADGGTIAIGAARNDGNGTNSGHVRVFSIFPNLTIPEDTPLSIDGIQVDDIDDNLVSTQLSVLNGFLTLALSDGATISAGSNNAASLTLQGTQAAINATLATLIYQGNQDFNGADRLTIISTDQEGLTDIDAITITVLPVDDPLILTIDALSIPENGGTTQGTISRGTQTVGDLIVNLSNDNNSKLSIPETVIIPDGQSSVSFTVSALDNAIADGDQIVQISAAAIDFTEATVALDIIDDETLTANDDERTTNEDTAIAIVPTTNDITPSSGLLIQSIETTNTQGSATLNAEQSAVLYDPNNAFEDLTTGETRTDTLIYTVTDDTGLTDTATVRITVEGVNDAPVASDDIVTTDIETAITIDVAANDTDVDSNLDFNSREITNGSVSGFLLPTQDGSRRVYIPASLLISPNLAGLLANAGIDLDTLDNGSLSVTNGPANGLLILPTDSSTIDYIPLPNFLGTDTFSYAIADIEGAQSNDAIVTVNVIPSNTLSLTIDPVSISENGGIATGQVRLTQAVAEDLQVILTTSNESEVTLPDSVIILAGETSTTFSLTGLNDDIVDGTQVLRISASAEAVIGAEAILEVTDDDVPALSLVIDRDRISENNDAARGILSRNTETIGDLVVNLVSSDTSEAFVNATVTIPNGEKTVVFAIEGVDDAIADGPQTVTITAQTAGFSDGTQTLEVTDDEVPALDFTIESPSISENGGVTRGIITRNTDPTDALVVNLGGEASDEVSVPSTVTLSAGQRSASFLISANDDAIADGDQTVSISASASGFLGALNSVTVTDDEVPTLSIAIPRPRLREKGEITIGTVFRNTVIGGGLPTDLGNTPINTDPFGNPSSNTSEDLVVTLTSSDTTEAIVPETVVIPAGQSSATFEIRPGDDLILDGPQQAIITASAPGFVSGQNQVSVADNETLETIDGNGDGIPDGNQDNVVSLLQLDNRNSEEDVLTLSGPDNIVLSNVSIRPNPAADAPDNPDFIADFPLGYLSFEVENVTIGDPFTLRLQLPDQFNTKGIDIDTYWKYGPTPENPVDHWYEFLFDGTTGAEFFDLDNDDVTDDILLHFLDGQRGDSDLTKNGTILDPGAPGVITNQAPNADNDTYTTTLFDAPLTVNALDGVLNGDTDPDGDLLSAKLETSTTQGIIQLDDDGSFTYIPKAGFVGIDSFTYTAFDGFQSSETAHVSIMVNALPEVPSNAMQGTNRTEKLRGSKGQDFLVGQDGRDRIFGRKGNDTISGGAGRDYIKGNKGNDLIDGGADDDVIKGGKGNDSILGGAGNDYIKGQKGHDFLIGGDGNDFLKGQKGNDTLIGGAGDDTLRGGRGSDIYVLSPESGLDRFEKFKLGDDKIGLADGLTFGALTVETQGKSSNLFLENELLAVVQLRGRGTLIVAEHFIAYNP